MKTFKQFLNEAANAIKSLGASGWGTRLKGEGGYNDSSGEWYFKQKRELFKKSKIKKMNGNDKSKYDKYNNPERPSEADLVNGIPIKKA